MGRTIPYVFAAISCAIGAWGIVHKNADCIGSMAFAVAACLGVAFLRWISDRANPRPRGYMFSRGERLAMCVLSAVPCGMVVWMIARDEWKAAGLFIGIAAFGLTLAFAHKTPGQR